MWNSWYYGAGTGIHDRPGFIKRYLNSAMSVDYLFAKGLEADGINFYR